jgi:hypothetical protein
MCSVRNVLKHTRRPRPTKRSGRIFCSKKYTEAERQLAAIVRKAAMGRDVLYHGTRHAQSILKIGVLFPVEDGGKVCFTRSAEEAAYRALRPRTEDEGRGAVLIFDRQLLHCRYKIEPYHDPIWDNKTTCHDEAEEAIWAEVTNVGKYLIGPVTDNASQSSDRLKTRNREYRRHIETRLNELLYFVPDWRCRPEEYLTPTKWHFCSRREN